MGSIDKIAHLANEPRKPYLFSPRDDRGLVFYELKIRISPRFIYAEKDLKDVSSCHATRSPSYTKIILY